MFGGKEPSLMETH